MTGNLDAEIAGLLGSFMYDMDVTISRFQTYCAQLAKLTNLGLSPAANTYILSCASSSDPIQHENWLRYAERRALLDLSIFWNAGFNTYSNSQLQQVFTMDIANAIRKLAPDRRLQGQQNHVQWPIKFLLDKDDSYGNMNGAVLIAPPLKTVIASIEPTASISAFLLNESLDPNGKGFYIPSIRVDLVSMYGIRLRE